MKTYETRRLFIRPFVLDDFQALFCLYNQKELMKYTDGNIRTKQETMEYLRSYIDDYKQYGFSLCAIFDKANGQMIGRGGLIPTELKQDIEGELAMMFKKLYWGQGLATEFCEATINYGFRYLGLKRIFAIVEPENVASVRVLQKIGMRFVCSTSSGEEYEIINESKPNPALSRPAAQ